MLHLIIGMCLGILPYMAQAQLQVLKPHTEGYAPVNGLQMYYQVYGEGRPLLLLHGAYMTIEMNWTAALPELTRNRRVIAVELQGHGRTADTERPLSYDSLASDVAALIGYLELDSVDMLGYSFGGTVAVHVAVLYPQLLRSLIVLSSVYAHEGWLPEVRRAMSSLRPEFFEHTPLKQAYDSIAPQPEHWGRFLDKMMRFDAQPFALSEKQIAGLGMPVLLVTGDNDGTDLAHVVHFYRLLGGNTFADMYGLPRSQLAILPGTTHVGLIQDTERLLPVIQAFLQQY